MELCIFSKQFSDLDFIELGQTLKAIGVDGVDLTVRPKGHVEPEAVRSQLPEASKKLADEGIKISMISTNVTSLDQPYAKDILETAASLGVKYIKLGNFKYEGFGTLRKTLGDAKGKLRALAAVAASEQLFLGCHNHSGKCIGAHLAHYKELIEDLDPNAIGLYYDPAHAMMEGMHWSWLAALDDVSDRVQMLAIKDTILTAKNMVEAVPMGQGAVRWKSMLQRLKTLESKIGPVSIHADINLPKDQRISFAQSEIQFFKNAWKEA